MENPCFLDTLNASRGENDFMKNIYSPRDCR